MKLLTFIVLLFAHITTFAADIFRHGFTAQQQAEMAEHNNNVSIDWAYRFIDHFNKPFQLQFSVSANDILPYAEYDLAKYLIFSEMTYYNSKNIKHTLARHLPDHMKLIIYTSSHSDIRKVRNEYASLMKSPSQLQVVYLSQASKGFWARDGVPVPVILNKASPQLGVVDAKYRHYFENDKEVAHLVGAELDKHNYYYEGGNMAANSRGECLIVNNNATAAIPDSIFRNKYGCRKTLRFDYLKGIGHVDEVIKFISDNTVVTNTEAYRSKLESNGYKVVMLPSSNGYYETYVNSLIINGTVFVPTYGHSNDNVALRVYKSLGLKVVGLNSSILSNNGKGSIHCITMTYPDLGFM